MKDVLRMPKGSLKEASRRPSGSLKDGLLRIIIILMVAEFIIIHHHPSIIIIVIIIIIIMVAEPAKLSPVDLSWRGVLGAPQEPVGFRTVAPKPPDHRSNS